MFKFSFGLVSIINAHFGSGFTDDQASFCSQSMDLDLTNVRVAGSPDTWRPSIDSSGAVRTCNRWTLWRIGTEKTWSPLCDGTCNQRPITTMPLEERS